MESILFHSKCCGDVIILLFTRVRNVISLGAWNGPHAAIIGLSHFHTQLVEFTKRYGTARICIRVETPAALDGDATKPLSLLSAKMSEFLYFWGWKKQSCNAEDTSETVFFSFPLFRCARAQRKDHGLEHAHSPLFFVLHLSSLFSLARRRRRSLFAGQDTHSPAMNI